MARFHPDPAPTLFEVVIPGRSAEETVTVRVLSDHPAKAMNAALAAHTWRPDAGALTVRALPNFLDASTWGELPSQ